MKTLAKEFTIHSGDMDVNVRFKSNNSLFEILRELKSEQSNVRLRGFSGQA